LTERGEEFQEFQKVRSPVSHAATKGAGYYLGRITSAIHVHTPSVQFGTKECIDK
jgi:hypothetical protein